MPRPTPCSRCKPRASGPRCSWAAHIRSSSSRSTRARSGPWRSPRSRTSPSQPPCPGRCGAASRRAGTDALQARAAPRARERSSPRMKRPERGVLDPRAPAQARAEVAAQVGEPRQPHGPHTRGLQRPRRDPRQRVVDDVGAAPVPCPAPQLPSALPQSRWWTATRSGKVRVRKPRMRALDLVDRVPRRAARACRRSPRSTPASSTSAHPARGGVVGTRSRSARSPSRSHADPAGEAELRRRAANRPSSSSK